MQIENVIKYIKIGRVKWTEHCSFRMFQRKIHKKDVEFAIMNGAVIEQYPNDFPYPSCLIIGNDLKGKIVHIVCGVGKENLFIITVYYPDDEKWINERIRRKK